MYNIGSDLILRNAVDTNGVKRAYIPLALLKQADYQRRCDMTKVRKISSEWDDYKANEIVVSFRDDCFYIVDGQHTVKAAEVVGKKDLYCKIYTGLTYEEEARLFVALNTMSTKVSVKQQYNALICAKDPESLVLENICKDFKVITRPSQADDKPVLRGLRSAQTTIRLCGENCLRWIFKVIQDSNWHSEPAAYGELMILVLRNIYRNHIEDLPAVKAKLCGLFKQCSPSLLKAQSNITFVGRGGQSAMTSLLENYLTSSTPVKSLVTK